MKTPNRGFLDEIDPERWVSNYGEMLLRYAIRKVGCSDLAEEILQETYASAMGTLQSFRGACSEKTWLFSILKHKISDHFRSVQKQYRLDTAVCRDAVAAWAVFDNRSVLVDPDQAYETKELVKLIHRALSDLPVKTALVFSLYEFDGVSKDKICRRMNIRTGYFYVILSRARQRIRRYLTKRK